MALGWALLAGAFALRFAADAFAHFGGQTLGPSALLLDRLLRPPTLLVEV